MNGREAAELIAWANRRVELKPSGPPLEGPEMWTAVLAATTRIRARQIIAANRPH